MIPTVLAFAAGIVWLQFQGTLPEPPALSILAAAGLVSCAAGLAAGRARIAAVVGAFLLGIAWAGALAAARLADGLDAELEGRDLRVSGVVAALPQAFENGRRFEFRVERAQPGVPERISLAWYRGWRPDLDDDAHAVPELRAGERWRLTVRLKRPHGNLNPHGFDYEAWLFEQGIRATGYVRPEADNRRIDGFVWRPGLAVERLRQAIRERFEAALGDAEFGGVLTALAIGDQRAIDADLWRVFSNTGVTHLLSVSGLHVTMVASLAWATVGWLWRRSARLPLRLPAQKAGAAAGFLAAFAYALLAGFAVPAQRTLYMLAVVTLALWTGRQLGSRRVLALALAAVLVLDPWAVTAAGFWLSFGCVGLLFYAGAGRLGPAGKVAAWLRAQWAVTVGMLPALLALFQQFSIVSPVANAVAIPMVSLVVTPLALLGTLPGGDLALLAGHGLLVPLMDFLTWLADSPWAVWQQAAPPPWAVLLGLAGGAWMLMPGGLPARWIGILAFLPLFLLPPPRPPAGQVRMTVLDVGQGLAIHLQTANHDLLYDTGPAFTPDANSGNRIILPYLRAAGVRRLDMLVLTHEDRDHAGGAESVLEALPTQRILGSLPGDHPLMAMPVPQRRCADGEAWEWDGVRFELLHPAAADFSARGKSNDLSCVLRVEAGGRAILLPSDIEARSEEEILARHRERIGAEVLVAPHHGSRTSSTPRFVAAVGAREIVFPVGYRNRFGHPKAEVLARYDAPGVRSHRTDRDGAVRIAVDASGIAVERSRDSDRRYWQGR